MPQPLPPSSVLQRSTTPYSLIPPPVTVTAVVVSSHTLLPGGSAVTIGSEVLTYAMPTASGSLLGMGGVSVVQTMSSGVYTGLPATATYAGYTGPIETTTHAGYTGPIATGAAAGRLLGKRALEGFLAAIALAAFV